MNAGAVLNFKLKRRELQGFGEDGHELTTGCLDLETYRCCENNEIQDSPLDWIFSRLYPFSIMITTFVHS
ncbi:hypothetical protein scyTo_0016522 [Scyliorhinus torazame]|uniref:Uncharacterized protein n=1 Tax=Scyliorhinus torazame TaxID=75743 RepID=A0A401PSJ0_SCYTO|nr:hypothetical protein [Scyliorhinus torazame]